MCARTPRNKSIARPALILLAAAAVAAVNGCSGLSDDSIVGKWERSVSVSGNEDSTPAERMAMEQMASAMSIDLYLRDDGTCTAWESGNSIDGTWVLSDRQVTLTFEKDAQLKFGDGTPMNLVVSEDGESMESATSLTDTSAGYVFRKSS